MYWIDIQCVFVFYVCGMYGVVFFVEYWYSGCVIYCSDEDFVSGFNVCVLLVGFYYVVCCGCLCVQCFVVVVCLVLVVFYCFGVVEDWVIEVGGIWEIGDLCYVVGLDYWCLVGGVVCCNYICLCQGFDVGVDVYFGQILLDRLSDMWLWIGIYYVQFGSKIVGEICFVEQLFCFCWVVVEILICFVIIGYGGWQWLVGWCCVFINDVYDVIFVDCYVYCLVDFEIIERWQCGFYCYVVGL